jgi:hypothetical protein
MATGQSYPSSAISMTSPANRFLSWYRLEGYHQSICRSAADDWGWSPNKTIFTTKTCSMLLFNVPFCLRMLTLSTSNRLKVSWEDLAPTIRGSSGILAPSLSQFLHTIGQGTRHACALLISTASSVMGLLPLRFLHLICGKTQRLSCLLKAILKYGSATTPPSCLKRSLAMSKLS